MRHTRIATPDTIDTLRTLPVAAGLLLYLVFLRIRGAEPPTALYDLLDDSKHPHRT